jgi:hypothetical protein
MKRGRCLGRHFGTEAIVRSAATPDLFRDLRAKSPHLRRYRSVTVSPSALVFPDEDGHMRPKQTALASAREQLQIGF